MHTESILEKAYDLLKYIMEVVGRIPKNQRFLIGDRMQSMAMDTLEGLTEAYYLPAAHKATKLAKVNMKLEMLRYFNRLCYEKGYYNSIKYKDVAERLLEVGRMTGGWIKSIRV